MYDCVWEKLCCGFANHKYLRRQVVHHASRKYVFVVALAGVEAAERPEMTQVELGKRAPIAKIAIGQNLRKEPVN